MKKFGFIVLFAWLILGVHAQVGEIVYIDGQIDIVREGNIYTEEDLSFGDYVENLDFFETGKNGELELEITKVNGIDANIFLQPESSFYLEISEVPDEQVGTVQLLYGSVGFKVNKLLGKNGFDVKTDTAVMGVRGTEFEVTTSVTGDILVTCEEGRVACIDESGDAVFAEPGVVVEKTEEQIFKRIPVALSSYKSFKKDWQAEKISALRANAPRAIRDFGIKYERFKRQFNLYYNRLMSHEDLINRWARQDREGSQGSLSELIGEKKEIIGSLISLKKNLFIFERVYFRLAELESYYQEYSIRGQIRSGYSIEDFFYDFNSDREVLRRKMAHVRGVMKSYARRNNGELPFETGFTDSITSWD